MLEYKYDSKLYLGKLEYATDLGICSISVLASQPQIIVNPSYLGSMQSVWHPKPHKWQPIQIEISQDQEIDGLIDIWNIHKDDKNMRSGYGGPKKKDFKLTIDGIVHILKSCVITKMKGYSLEIDVYNVIS